MCCGESFKVFRFRLIFDQIRSLCFNKEYKEIAVISLNGYIHLFNAETFSQVSFFGGFVPLWLVRYSINSIPQKLSRKLPNCQDNVCIACQPNGLYAVGCRSYTLLLDPRTLQVRYAVFSSKCFFFKHQRSIRRL